MDMNSLSHSKREYKYYVVFAPKFRRKAIYGQLKRDIANILSTPIYGAQTFPVGFRAFLAQRREYFNHKCAGL